ncbi:hypothetical protein NEOLI_002674 [Neolecta irregularis DAH-3]|uniref:Uncharacterized protein n=1 Tax=Neolecta irregularis (strain DAH-3) TaxID=1198029 RepID=A0A1U7LHX8_NEOID|nr:hypothetical protein NEOLI_002674 [Neolecta irregularis DAH-3]|eukprot:OLL22257.1 hypothetical protein NEOLI_002674 [Neolecta irregularis DAH-3]
MTDEVGPSENSSFLAVLDSSLPKKPTINVYIPAKITEESIEIAKNSSYFEDIRELLKYPKFQNIVDTGAEDNLAGMGCL